MMARTLYVMCVYRVFVFGVLHGIVPQMCVCVYFCTCGVACVYISAEREHIQFISIQD